MDGCPAAHRAVRFPRTRAALGSCPNSSNNARLRILPSPSGVCIYALPGICFLSPSVCKRRKEKGIDRYRYELQGFSSLPSFSPTYYPRFLSLPSRNPPELVVTKGKRENQFETAAGKKRVLLQTPLEFQVREKKSAVSSHTTFINGKGNARKDSIVV